MNFNCELVGMKTLSDGALRITLDIPEIDQAKVLSQISEYRGKALEADIDTSDNMTIIKTLRVEAHMAIKTYATLKGLEYQAMHDKILASDKMFPGKNYTSLKQLSISELRQLIKAVE